MCLSTFLEKGTEIGKADDKLWRERDIMVFIVTFLFAFRALAPRYIIYKPPSTIII